MYFYGNHELYIVLTNCYEDTRRLEARVYKSDQKPCRSLFLGLRPKQVLGRLPLGNREPNQGGLGDIWTEVLNKPIFLVILVLFFIFLLKIIPYPVNPSQLRQVSNSLSTDPSSLGR